MRLEEKVVIVTGAGRGIGRGIALGMAREGAAMAAASITYANAVKVAREINDAGGQAIPIRVDVSDQKSVQELVEATVSGFGKITTLVNVAGVMSRTPFLETTAEEWLSVLDVNLNGVFYVTQAVAKEMIRAGGGSIINFSSLAAERGIADRVAYAASKGGVKAMNMSLAMTLAPYNIRVNAVAPGPVPTDMNPQLQTDAAAIAAWTGSIPLHRLGSPDDFAGICIYLASDESSWVTGTHICIDGGYTALFASLAAPAPR